jgi:ATP adenylyltransferase
MWTCLGEFEGLVFYNGGKLAGASQRHKHLQIVPFSETDIPISPLLKTAKLENDMGTIQEFPFLHAFTNLNRGESPKVTLEKYHTLLQKMGIKPLENNLQSGAYNLLITQKWMLIVPRKQEEIEGISINSLGFAGALLVKNCVNRLTHINKILDFFIFPRNRGFKCYADPFFAFARNKIENSCKILLTAVLSLTNTTNIENITHLFNLNK